MNNILTFEDYKKMNIRQVESVIYRQFMEDNIKEEVNEGFIRNAINKASGKFIQNALADEIEKGKELEKSIKEALDGLNKGFEEISKNIDSNQENDKDSKSKLASIEKVKEAIKAVQSQAFDTLTMIGSEGEIDFAGFLGSATVAAAANFGILFSPIRSLFITRKAYKYFLGIIKQTIRRNLLVIQLNFDQFENLILQKSFETEEDSEMMTKNGTLHEIIGAMQSELCGKNSKMFSAKKSKEMKSYLDAFKKAQEISIKEKTERTKNNPLSSLWADQHNNTYTRTLEQIKQYINDDSQKELDALKNSITKMSGNDVELGPYGELLISAAEEYAIHTNHGINNNFIKMSSVFNLDNQKKLIELIKDAQEENQKEIERKQKEIDDDKIKKEAEKSIEEGKRIYEEKLKDSTETYTFDNFSNEFGDVDIKNLRAFFTTDEGKNEYKELIKKHPTYKYFIFNDETLNYFLNSINNLKVIEVSNIDEFNDNITKKEQALYYMMAERSIKDAITGNKSEDFFGFDITDNDIDEDNKNFLKSKIVKKDEKSNKKISNIFKEIFDQAHDDKLYLLTFDGSGSDLFNILHNEFKTNIFKDSGKYENDISTENKEDIMKLIYKQIKIGNNISTKFSEYLVRLEAHMLLNNKKPWFVPKNNSKLKSSFIVKSDKIINKNAFVRISKNDYDHIKKFLMTFHELSNKDFDISPTEKETNN